MRYGMHPGFLSYRQAQVERAEAAETKGRVLSLLRASLIARSDAEQELAQAGYFAAEIREIVR